MNSGSNSQGHLPQARKRGVLMLKPLNYCATGVIILYLVDLPHVAFHIVIDINDTSSDMQAKAGTCYHSLRLSPGVFSILEPMCNKRVIFTSYPAF